MVESCPLVWISFGAVICDFVWRDPGPGAAFGESPGSRGVVVL